MLPPRGWLPLALLPLACRSTPSASTPPVVEAKPASVVPAPIASVEPLVEEPPDEPPHGVVIGTFGHAGDGNLHPTIVFEHRDPSSRERAYAAFDEIVRDAMRLGGSITGEHGVGSLKRDYLAAMVGEAELALMRRIKATFDPHNILNPGKAL